MFPKDYTAADTGITKARTLLDHAGGTTGTTGDLFTDLIFPSPNTTPLEVTGVGETHWCKVLSSNSDVVRFMSITPDGRTGEGLLSKDQLPGMELEFNSEFVSIEWRTPNGPVVKLYPACSDSYGDQFQRMMEYSRGRYDPKKLELEFAATLKLVLGTKVVQNTAENRTASGAEIVE
jgi:hypothetical protein